MVYDDDLPTKNGDVPFRELVNQQRVNKYSLKQIHWFLQLVMFTHKKGVSTNKRRDFNKQKIVIWAEQCVFCQDIFGTHKK